MSGEPTETVSRRRFVAATGSIGLSAGLAGCSGGGGGDSGGDGQDGDGSSGGSSSGSGSGSRSGGGGQTSLNTEMESAGTVTENTFGNAEVVGLRSFEAQDHNMAPDGQFVVAITLRNTGEDELDPIAPDYSLTLYDDGDGVLNDGPNQGTNAVINASDAAPGELTGVDAYTSQVEYGAVARYEVALTQG